MVDGRRAVGLAALVVVPLTFAGCSQPVEIPPTDVKVVEAYGLTLDEQATPEQVVYVLLRSIREDVEAAQAKDRPAQRKAFRVTFSLGAFDEIERRLAAGMDQKARERLAQLRDKRIYDVINHWAPIVSHYVRSFEIEQKAAIARMRVEKTVLESKPAAIVLYDAAHDPTATEPADRQPATIEVTLVQQTASGGSSEFWRVARVAFRGPRARMPAEPPIPDLPPSAPTASSPEGR